MRLGRGVQLLKAAINEGRFGRLTLCSASIKWWRAQSYYDSSNWKGTWKLDGGGALMNQGIHAVDLLQWLGSPGKFALSRARSPRIRVATPRLYGCGSGLNAARRVEGRLLRSDTTSTALLCKGHQQRLGGPACGKG